MLLLTLRMSTSTRHQHQSDSLGPRLTPGQRARLFLRQPTFKPSQTGTIQIKNRASVGENIGLDIQISETGLSRPHTGKAHRCTCVFTVLLEESNESEVQGINRQTQILYRTWVSRRAKIQVSYSWQQLSFLSLAYLSLSRHAEPMSDI